MVPGGRNTRAASPWSCASPASSWHVIIFEKGLQGPIKLFPVTKGSLGSNSSDHHCQITGCSTPPLMELCKGALPRILHTPFLIFTTTVWGGIITLLYMSEGTEAKRGYKTQAESPSKEVTQPVFGSRPEQSSPQICFPAFCFVSPFTFL